MEEQALSREELIVTIYHLEMELFRLSRDADLNYGRYDSSLPSLKTVINKLRQLLLSMEWMNESNESNIERNGDSLWIIIIIKIIKERYCTY